MGESIINSLAKAMNEELKELETTENLEKRGKIYNNIDKLSGPYVEILREEYNHEEKLKRLEMEKDQYDDGILDKRDEMVLKQEELNEKKKSRWWNSGIAIGTTVIGGVITLVTTAGMFYFEEEHSFTSSLRNGVQKYVFDLFKKKK